VPLEADGVGRPCVHVAAGVQVWLGACAYAPPFPPPPKVTAMPAILQPRRESLIFAGKERMKRVTEAS